MPAFAGYCDNDDVKAINPEFDFSGSTVPTDTDVDAFRSRVGIDLNGILESLGYVNPANATDSPDGFEWLKHANAVGAAAYADQAATSRPLTNAARRSSMLMEQYKDLKKDLKSGEIVLDDLVKQADYVVQAPAQTPLTHVQDTTLALDADIDLAADFKIDKSQVMF